MTPADAACKYGRAMWVYWRTQSTWWLLLCSTTKLQFFKRCPIYCLLPRTFNYHLVTFLSIVLWHVEEDDLWHQRANRCPVCHSICLGCKEWAYLVLLHCLIVLYHCSVHLCAFFLRQAVQSIQCVEVCHYNAHQWASLLDLRGDVLYQQCDAKVPAHVEALSTLSAEKEGSLLTLICLLSMCNYCHYPGWYCMLTWMICNVHMLQPSPHVLCIWSSNMMLPCSLQHACSFHATNWLFFTPQECSITKSTLHFKLCSIFATLVFHCVWIIWDYSIVTSVSTMWYTLTIA